MRTHRQSRSRPNLAPISELRLAARALLRRPLFAALSIGLLGLALAAVGTITAVVNATLLRPLPYRAPERLYVVSAPERVAGDSTSDLVLGARLLTRWRAESKAFDDIEGYTPATLKLTGNGEPEPLPGAYVSGGFFDVLGVTPALGRAFRREDEVAGSGVAVISYGLWQRRFGGKPTVIGMVLDLDDEPRAIVGVMPKGFSMLFQRADVWTPIALGPAEIASRARTIAGIGRLRAGYSEAQAKGDLAAITEQMGREFPVEYRMTTVKLVMLHESLFGGQRASVLVVLAAVALLLVIAVVNLAALGFADVVSRRTATMTRLVLGATRGQVARARGLEALVVGLAATIPGLAGARLALAALQTVASDAFTGFGAVSVDWSIVVLLVALSPIAALLSSVPALLGESRLGVGELAGSTTRSIGGRAERRTRELLLSLQVGGTLVLMACAALLARNVVALMHRPQGFEPQGVMVVEMTVSSKKYETVEKRADYIARVVDAVRALPGVTGASTTQTRFVLNETMQTVIEVEGHPPVDGVLPLVNIRHVMPDVFKVLRTRVIQGRGIEASDNRDAQPVAVVSQSFAKQYWGRESPVGKRIRRVTRTNPPWLQVVGVVEDVMDAGVGVSMLPTIYVAYLQQNTQLARTTIVARVTGGMSSLPMSVRNAVWSVDPAQTINAITPLDELLRRSAAQPRFQSMVVALFSGAALLLVLAGVYAITLHGVLARTRELGVRAALGARPNSLVQDAMWRSLRPVATGLALGAVLAVPSVTAMQRALSAEFTVADAWLLAGAAVVVFVATAVAALFPARTALSIPASIAMRA